MSIDILAQGTAWRLSSNNEVLCLELLDECGIVEIEVKPEAPNTQELLHKIAYQHRQLAQLGPVTVEEQVTA